MTPAIPDYGYHHAEPDHTAAYVWPTVFHALGDAPLRVLDLGCGNGALTQALQERGHSVVGIDPSEKGIAIGTRAYPGLDLHVASTSDPLAEQFGTFDAVVSVEVVEHVYSPREYAEAMFRLSRPGGRVILSTPYHGYLKNLALALSGKMDTHFTALWEGGHIKFWSPQTISTLLADAGFEPLAIHRVGRVPVAAKSMVAVARRP